MGNYAYLCSGDNGSLCLGIMIFIFVSVIYSDEYKYHPKSKSMFFFRFFCSNGIKKMSCSILYNKVWY